MPTKQMKGWEVVIYNPNSLDSPREEWNVIYEGKFKNIRDVHKGWSWTNKIFKRFDAY